MKFTNVRELKNKTSELLRITDKGEDVIVTCRGKPRAIIQHFSEDELEDYVILNHPKIKEKLAKAYREYLEGKAVDLDELISQTKKEIGKV